MSWEATSPNNGREPGECVDLLMLLKQWAQQKDTPSPTLAGEETQPVSDGRLPRADHYSPLSRNRHVDNACSTAICCNIPHVPMSHEDFHLRIL